MWSRLSRSQSVSFIWTSAARMSPPSVGLVLQGTEAPMWDTFSSVLTHSSAHSGGPTHGVRVYARNARVSRRVRTDASGHEVHLRICGARYLLLAETRRDPQLFRSIVKFWIRIFPRCRIICLTFSFLEQRRPRAGQYPDKSTAINFFGGI